MANNASGHLMRGAFLAIVAITSCQAQWTLQRSHTTANLRGIHNAGGGVVWASGSRGTILHSTNNGQTWQTCAVPSGAENLDFRGIQAFDAHTAIVMSAGPGDLSRLYKTVDACRSWKLVFANPDASGFWDALQFTSPKFGVLIGDQVQGHFPVFFSTDAGDTWRQFDANALSSGDKNQSFFAASNTSLIVDSKKAKFYMITGGGITSLITVDWQFAAGTICNACLHVSNTRLDMASGETAGGYSLASRAEGSNPAMVAVGGDYKSPDRAIGTAASSIGNNGWRASDTPPNGYRSAVAYYPPGKSWIAVGPNGTDISNDDGRTWRALKPAAGETPDADKNWNALSLPFVAGANGRIGRLNADAMKPRSR